MGLRKTVMIAGLGAALAYYLDPISGLARRARLRAWANRVLKRDEELKDYL